MNGSDAAVVGADIVDKYVVGHYVSSFCQAGDEDIGSRVACFAVAANTFFPTVDWKLVNGFEAGSTVVGQGYEVEVAGRFDGHSHLYTVAYFEGICRLSYELPCFVVEIELLVDLNIGGRLLLHFLHRCIVLAVDGSPRRIVAIAFYGQFVAFQCAIIE